MAKTMAEFQQEWKECTRIMNKGIIAVFGGSFNPPLNSHFSLAEQVLEEIKEIEKIIFVPVSTKYSKSGLVEDKHRYNMLKMVCNKNPKFEVSDIEIKAEKQPYTIETLDRIKEQNPEKDIYFIIGTDNLKELCTWHTAEKILQNYKILVLQRDEDNVEKIIEDCPLLKKYKTSIIELKNIVKIKLSSSIVREKLKNAESIKYLAPDEIIEYIKKEKLY